MKTIRLIARAVSIVSVVAIVGYITYINASPFGASTTYNLTTKGLSPIGPSDRVQATGNIIKQVDNSIYFTAKMPFSFDHARVRMTYMNSAPDQEVSLGYKDQDIWHYDTAVLDSPLLNNLTWPKIGNGPYLYQKNPTYSAANTFLQNPPTDKIIGTYDYDKNDLTQVESAIPDYKPATTDTSINTLLRGKTVLYVYLNNEPFHMKFTKQDLNWYADPDVMNIQVYRQKDMVYDTSIDDDGNANADHQLGTLQDVEIKNPGPGLPENGVYKVVINASSDVVLTNVTTNLHKIVFQGPIYPVDNHEVYGGLVNQTEPTVLTTDASNISVQSSHGVVQKASLGSQSINIQHDGQEYTFSNQAAQGTLTLPASDAVINGIGYFAFSPDQFFKPSPYKILAVRNGKDLGMVDYVLTDYQGKPAPTSDGWLVTERDFDLTRAIIQKGKLSWIINAPDLKNNNRNIAIKSITITLTKKGWFKR